MKYCETSTQFVHFEFTAEQILKFRDARTLVRVGIDHPKYGHIATLSGQTRDELALDFI